jgi:hypothetical protein
MVDDVNAEGLQHSTASPPDFISILSCCLQIMQTYIKKHFVLFLSHKTRQKP